MTKQEQREAIAEACGLSTKREVLGGVYVYRDKEGQIQAALPDYLHDLNAMHEAEKCLPALPYLYRLQEVCGGRMETSGDLSRIIKATAPQRAEAFLRTVGKWKDA